MRSPARSQARHPRTGASNDRKLSVGDVLGDDTGSGGRLMKAYLLHTLGHRPVVTDAPKPVVGVGEVLIRVQASSVNPVDALVARGFFSSVQEYRLPAILGRDVAGVVEAVEATVTRFAPGDRVWGFIKRNHIGDGTFAEYVSCRADHFITETPDAISTQDAGVLGLAGVTALDCLDSLQLAAGDTVFINGASGGAGSMAVQFAAAAGLRVVATARSGPQTDFVAGLGAATVLDWTDGSIAEQVRAVAPAGVAGYLDLVRHTDSSVAGSDESAGKQIFAKLATAVLAVGGRACSTTNSADPALLHGIAATNIHSDPSPQTLRRIAELMAIGAVRAPIEQVFDLGDIHAAFERLHGGVTGKIGIRIGS